MRERNELATVQALRAGACLMVVAYHGLLAGWPDAAPRWPNGSAGVDLFFVISGFVMITSSERLRTAPRGWRVFLRRRLLRIVPLYWLLTAAKLSIVSLAPALAAHTRPDAWNVAASFLFVPAVDAAGQVRPVLPVGWTLNFEMLFYGLFALALALRARPLPGLILPLGLLAVAGFWRRDDWPALFTLANGLVLEFAFGMAIGEAFRRGWLRGGPILLCCGALVLFTAPLAGPWRFIVWGLPAAAILASAVAMEPRWGPRMPRWIVASGDASYATYLAHPFVVPGLAWLGPAAPVAALPASLAVGFAVHAGLDRPLRQWLRGRFGAPPPALSQAAN